MELIRRKYISISEVISLSYNRTHWYVPKKMRYCEYGPRGHIHNTSFRCSSWTDQISSSFELHKPEKGCQWQALHLIMPLYKFQKSKLCWIWSLRPYSNASFLCSSWRGPIVRVLHYTSLERLASDKLSSLLCPIICYEENEMLWTWPQNPENDHKIILRTFCECHSQIHFKTLCSIFWCFPLVLNLLTSQHNKLERFKTI
jgi:hypothetical protein